MAERSRALALPLHTPERSTIHAGEWQLPYLAQGSNDRLVRARGRVAVGASGAGTRHRTDAAGRAGPRLVREDDGGGERADDDRAARIDRRTGPSRVEFPQELLEDQPPAGQGVRR